MTSMSVRDVRLHWPIAEKALAEGEEILITRDSKPVARLLPLVPGATQKRQRFDPVAHAKRMERFWRKRPAQPSTDVLLARDRDE
jgi:antitoxin (DNA-binding transcriptional repressor) of toxin-antitoxin stability system